MKIATHIALCLAFSFSAATAVFGQETSTAAVTVVPSMVTFTGVLPMTAFQGPGPSEAAARPMTADFSLYESQEGGEPLWSETREIQVEPLGRYTVQLGANSAAGVPREFFTSRKAMWLGVRTPQSGPAELPRVLLVAVPYALKASDADMLGGMPASAFALAKPRAGEEAADLRGVENSSNALPQEARPQLTTDSQTLFTGTIAQPGALVESQQKGNGDALLLQSLEPASYNSYLIRGQAGATPATVFKVDTRGDITASMGAFS